MVLKVKQNRHEIQDFSFESLSPGFSPNESVKSYKLKSLDSISAFKNKIDDHIIRAEREAESKSAFNIDSKVRDRRGLSKQAEDDFEKAVGQEVIKRLNKIKDDAQKEGFQTGQKQGHDQAYAEAVAKYDMLITEFAQWIETSKNQLHDIFIKAQQDSYKIIKSLIKWILLKEVDDKEYISRLLEKLILEMNAKTNLVLRVNKASFDNMDDVLNIVQEKVGKLSNTRVEAHLDLEYPGIILECENGIVDGSLEAQFSSLDKIFDSVIHTNEK